MNCPTSVLQDMSINGEQICCVPVLNISELVRDLPILQEDSKLVVSGLVNSYRRVEADLPGYSQDFATHCRAHADVQHTC